MTLSVAYFPTRRSSDLLTVLDDWLRSYRAEELFDEHGRLLESVAAAAPEGHLRMSANPATNGGSLLEPLRLPDFRDYAVDVPLPGASVSEATRVLGRGCATSSATTLTTSGSSDPTR